MEKRKRPYFLNIWYILMCILQYTFDHMDKLTEEPGFGPLFRLNEIFVSGFYCFIPTPCMSHASHDSSHDNVVNIW